MTKRSTFQQLLSRSMTTAIHAKLHAGNLFKHVMLLQNVKQNNCSIHAKLSFGNFFSICWWRLTHKEKELNDTACRLGVSNTGEAVGVHEPDVEPQIGEKHEDSHPSWTPHNVLSLHGLHHYVARLIARTLNLVAVCMGRCC